MVRRLFCMGRRNMVVPQKSIAPITASFEFTVDRPGIYPKNDFNILEVNVTCTTQQYFTVAGTNDDQTLQLLQCAEKQVPVTITITQSLRRKEEMFPKNIFQQTKVVAAWPSHKMLVDYKKEMNEDALNAIIQNLKGSDVPTHVHIFAIALVHWKKV